MLPKDQTQIQVESESEPATKDDIISILHMIIVILVLILTLIVVGGGTPSFGQEMEPTEEMTVETVESLGELPLAELSTPTPTPTPTLATEPPLPPSTSPPTGESSLYPWPEDPNNLLKNPSFETISPTTNRPTDWSFGQPTFWKSESENCYEGNKCLRLEDTSGGGAITPLASQSPALPESWYNFRGYMKMQLPKNPETGEDVEQKAAAGGRIDLEGGGSTDTAGETSDWELYSQNDALLLPAKPTTPLRLTPFRRPYGTLYFDNISLHRQIPPKIDAFVLYPNYRGYILPNQSQEVRVSFTINQKEIGEIPLQNLRVHLRLQKENGDAIASKEITPTSLSFVDTIDASSLPLDEVGQVRFQVFDSTTTKLVFEYPHYKVRRLSEASFSKLHLYVDKNNILVLGGKRKFGLGIYNTGGYSLNPDYYLPLANKFALANFNLYLNYFLGQAPIPAIRVQMDAFGTRGIYYFQTVNRLYPDDVQWPKFSKCEDKSPESWGYEEYVKCVGRAFTPHPFFAGWYSMDERTADRSYRQFKQLKLLETDDPDGLSFIASNKPRELGKWRFNSKISTDSYPVRLPDPPPPAPQAINNLREVYDWVKMADVSIRSSRLNCGVIQFFKTVAKSHWPTQEELRSMSYMAIIAGANCLWYWSHGYNALQFVSEPLKTEYWNRLKAVTGEISSIENILISPDSSVLQPSEAPIVVRTKEVEGIRYVIAANLSTSTVSATLTMLNPAQNAEVLFENRNIPIESETQLSDSFPPNAVHIYKIS